MTELDIEYTPAETLEEANKDLIDVLDLARRCVVRAMELHSQKQGRLIRTDHDLYLISRRIAAARNYASNLMEARWP